jgi:hypothetical protein
VHVPEPIISHASGVDPEHEAALANSVGLARLVVLETLTPAERLALVLHDRFAVPFEEIAPMIERSPAAVEATREPRTPPSAEAGPAPDPNLTRQREVINAFFAAARNGNFDALVAVLDPDVVLRADGGLARPRHTVLIAGARAVAEQALTFGRPLPVRTTGADQRSRRSHSRCTRTAAVRHGLHRRRREDPRHRRAISTGNGHLSWEPTAHLQYHLTTMRRTD